MRVLHQDRLGGLACEYAQVARSGCGQSAARRLFVLLFVGPVRVTPQDGSSPAATLALDVYIRLRK